MFANTNIYGYFQRFLLNILPLLLICNPYFGVPSPPAFTPTSEVSQKTFAVTKHHIQENDALNLTRQKQTSKFPT